MEKQNFKLVYQHMPFVDSMLEAIENHPAWDKSQRILFKGSPHREAEDILLRGPRFDGRTLAAIHQSIECVDYADAEFFEVIMSTVFTTAVALKAEYIGRIMLTKLPPGKCIYLHQDEGKVPEFYDRFHLCLTGGIQNYFFAGTEMVIMYPGELWWVDVTKPHSVDNRSDKQPRIHLVFDLHNASINASKNPE